MTSMRVAVTGATGFVGAPLVAELVDSGAEVHAASRHAPPAAGHDVDWREVDLEDAAATRSWLASVRPHRIYHLSSLVTGRRDLELVVPALRANLASTVHLLAAAAELEVERIVLAGSMEEPAEGEAPGSPYAAAKAAATLYARLFHALYATPVVIARIFMVYGPGQRDLDKVVPASIRTALAGERPRISSGTRAVDWIYVDDVVAGLLALGAAPGVEGRSLDIGTGELHTVRQVVERICTLCGVAGPEVGAVADRPLERVVRASPEATTAATGWRCRHSLDDGLRHTIDAMRVASRP